MADDNTVSSEAAFFEEKDEVLSLIAAITGEGVDVSALDGLVEQVAKVLEKYQEQSSLLDPALEPMMNLLTERSRELMAVVYEEQLASQQQQQQQEPPPAAAEEVAGAPFRCEPNPQQHAIFQVVYNLCRCRGYKTVIKFFPHEVSDLEPLMVLLQGQDRADHTTWESRYGLLLWLSMIVLVPFDIYTIDSSGWRGGQTLVGSILDLCRDYMQDSGPTRDAAAVCLSSLLTRPDMDESYFLEFVTWAGGLLSQEGVFRTSQQTFLVTGVLMTLTAIFKKGHRSKLLGVIEHLFPHILHIAQQSSQSTLLRKLNAKLFQRMGMAFLPPRVVSWAYQRGQRSLLQNMGGDGAAGAAAGGGGSTSPGDEDDEDDVDIPDELEDIVEQLLVGLRDRDTIVRWSAAKGIGRITSRLPKDLADDVVAAVFELFSDSEGDGAWHGGCLAMAELARRGLLLPFRLPEAVPVVVKAIHYDVRRGSNSVGAHVRDAACYVCWAFARAYSPEVMRPLVDSLCEGMLLAALFDREINCRRAAAAAFQENVGRQGHQNFPHGIEILTAADYFTLGVRSNAYLKISVFVAQFEKYRRPLMAHIYEVKLFHWDIAVRELSARALSNMTHLDPGLVAHTAIPSLLPFTSSSDLLKRHGSILGVAEAVAALTALSFTIPPDTVSEIIAVVPQIEKARLYRGRGGEIVRQAACRLIECIAIARLPLPVKMQVRLLDSIDESVKHSMEPVQLQAVAALRMFTRSYFPVAETGPSPRLQARIVDKYVDIVRNADIASSTRGFALGLGVLPVRLVAHTPAHLERIIETLQHASNPLTKIGDEPDAETRRNAINALVELCETVGVGGERGLTAAQVESVFGTLLLAMKDYSMDKRGDVGSWSRVAAMTGLEKLALRAVSASPAVPQDPRGNPTPPDASDPAVPDEEARGKFLAVGDSGAAPPPPPSRGGCEAGLFFTSTMVDQLFCALLKQLCEKLDNVRSKAGSGIERLLKSDAPRVAFVSCRTELETAMLTGADVGANWGLASETFPKIIKTLDLPTYQKATIAGLVLSVGGLTEAVVKSSSSALLDWARSKKNTSDWEALNGFSGVLLNLFDEYKGDDRVTLPLMKTIELLLGNDVFDYLAAEEPPSFAVGLLERVKKEIGRSTNVIKLFTGINIALALFEFSGAANRGAQRLVVEVLGHRYPRVRKHAAEQFYTKLLVDENLVSAEVYESVLEVLSTTVWDAELPLVRQERDRIAAAMGIELARPAAASGGAAKPKAKKSDALDSYQHLIDEVGY